MPRSTGAGEQDVGGFWSGGTGGVVWEWPLGRSFPGIEQRLDKTPTLLDKIRAGKERGIAGHHVVQETFVSFAVVAERASGKLEVHPLLIDRCLKTRSLDADAEANPLFGLQ